MATHKPTLYLETTVPSYLTARPSRDVVVLAHQQLTREWWEGPLADFDIMVSEVVLDEARRGDAVAARARLAVLAPFAVLPVTVDVERLAQVYVRELRMARDALRDALHIAIASVHEIDYLLTWNCRHIASGRTRRGVRDVNSREDLKTPTICTPEELLHDYGSSE